MSRIHDLAKEYFGYDKYHLIDKHFELLKICIIRGSKDVAHPHNLFHVYISRKALKHFVDSRKNDYGKYHSKEETFTMLFFIINSLKEAIVDFSQYTFEPPNKHFYIKVFSGRPSIRILLEVKENRLEIVSIHFQKNKKTTTQ